MEPTLVDGQGLLGIPTRSARVGELRCLERVAEVHSDGTMSVLSDNRDATLADSRTFGRVPVAGSYRVVVRIPRRLM
jgi:hypothetical protein